MNCRRTGLSFEPTSKRQKLHPAIAALFAEKQVVQCYEAACAAATEILRGDVAIAEPSSVVAYIKMKIVESNDARIAERKAKSQAWESQKADRKRFNDQIKSFGWRWVYMTEESWDFTQNFHLMPEGWLIQTEHGLVTIAEARRLIALMGATS